MVKKPKCYLDKRRNCYHPDQQSICKKNRMICRGMEPMRGEFHRLLRTYQFLQENPGYVDENHFIGEVKKNG